MCTIFVDPYAVFVKRNAFAMATYLQRAPGVSFVRGNCISTRRSELFIGSVASALFVMLSGCAPVGCSITSVIKYTGGISAELSGLFRACACYGSFDFDGKMVLAFCEFRSARFDALKRKFSFEVDRNLPVGSIVRVILNRNVFIFSTLMNIHFFHSYSTIRIT